MRVCGFVCQSLRHDVPHGMAGRFIGLHWYVCGKGLVGIDSKSLVRFASGTRFTPKDLTTQTHLKESEERTTVNSNTIDINYKDKGSQFSLVNQNSVGRKMKSSMENYISDIVLGTNGGKERNPRRGAIGDYNRRAENTGYFQNRSRKPPFYKIKHPLSSYKKIEHISFKNADDNEVYLNGFDDDSINYVLEKRMKFMEKSSEYDNSSVFKGIQCRMQLYKSEIDDAKIKLLLDSMTDNRPMSLDVVSEGIQSFCRLPMDKLQEHAAVELPSALTKATCRFGSTLKTDVFCDALMMLVRLHCSLLPKELQILEEACLQHLKSWDLHTMLLVSDCWLCLGQYKLLYYKEMISTAILYYGSELTGQNITQLFYVIGFGKTTPHRGAVLKLLQIIERSLSDLTWVEIGIICFGLVKGGSPLSEQSTGFLTALNQRYVRGLRANEIDIYSMRQVMRYIARRYYCNVETFDILAATVTPVIQNNPQVIRVEHFAAGFAKVRMFHKPMMDAIVEHVMQEKLPNRIKDVHLLLWACGRLNYKTDDTEHFFRKLIQTLHTKVQMSRTRSPLLFLRSLVSLSFLDYYPATLINQAFTPDFLQICDEDQANFAVNTICKQLFTLDCSVAVECPEYSGNRLPQRYIKMYEDVPHGSVKFKWEEIGEAADVIRLLRKMFGHKDYVKIHPILPHIKTPADIEVHLAPDGNPVFPTSYHSDPTMSPNLANVAIPYNKLEQCVRETIGMKCRPGVQRLAVLVTSSKQHHCNSPGLLGVHVMKRRQLRKVGYKIMEIPHYEWNQLSQTDEQEKMNYLKSKIENTS